MKIYLDDVREAPEGWTRVYWPREAIDLLKTNVVEEISLDHDLGDTDVEHPRTGYDVLLWIEKAVATSPMPSPVPKITIHSANSVGRERMQRAVESIERFVREREARKPEWKP